MGKWLNTTVCAGCMAVLLAACAAIRTDAPDAPEPPMKKKPIVSTTIDFLDYAFYDMEGAADHYELAVWEKRLQELAACGITKVYLRVNILGLTHWPSKVSTQYGTGGRVHYGDKVRGMRLARTYEKYDVLAETIRLGHKYGLAVWCWDSTWDEAAWPEDRIAFAEDVAKFGAYPLMDDWYDSHPGNWSRHDPRLDPPDLPAVDVREHPISRIVIVSEKQDTRPCRIRRENLALLVSDDGRKYTDYAGDFQAVSSLNGDGHPQLELTGLAIRSPYVKFHQDGTFNDKDYTMVFSKATSLASHVYDDRGQEMAVTWGQRLDRQQTPADAPVAYGRFHTFAWDAGFYQLGLHTAPNPDLDREKWCVGIPELLLPAVRAHKLDRFRELVAYPFDGFLFNIRSHSIVSGLAGDALKGAYGFNPEIMAEFKRRTGKDVLTDEYDREAYDNLRSEGLDRFLAECKALTGGRPLYMTVGIPDQDKIRNTISGAANWLHAFGMRFHVDQWLTDSAVDGITLLGNHVNAVPPEFLNRKANGRPLKISVFREMAFPPEGKNYDFRSDINRLVANPDIDEIELYESLVINEERRDIIRRALNGATPPTAARQGHAEDLARIKEHFATRNANWTWVFYGDSITHGAAHTHGWRSFPEIFQERVRYELNRLMDCIINSGNSGYTSLDLLDEKIYDWQVRRHKPDVVLLLIGCNDIVRPECGGPEKFRERLTELTRRCRQDGAIPILQTYNTIQLVKNPTSDYLLGYIKRYNEFPEYNQIIRDVAKAEDTILIDHRRLWEEKAADPQVLDSWLGETIHPGPAGHLQMAILILKELGLFSPDSKCCALPAP